MAYFSPSVRLPFPSQGGKMLCPSVVRFAGQGGIQQGVQVPPRPPTKNNYQGNQRLLLVSNAAVEAENNIRTIKAAVQP